MPVAAFEPKFMKIGVLTAALQELTPREKRDKDPDLAIEEWIAFARQLGADYIQLSAALHPTKADVPAEAMLDPVANTLDLRKPPSISEVIDWARALGVLGRGVLDEGTLKATLGVLLKHKDDLELADKRAAELVRAAREAPA